MTVEERQAKLDVAKWIKSEEMGRDCCGEFDYCSKCNKDEDYPCARAFDRFNAKPVKKAAAKAPAPKKEAAATKTVTAKKVPAKKTTATAKKSAK